MKERPILFSGPMVRAIREGRKTQTRRIIKPQPPRGWKFNSFDTLWYWWTPDGTCDLNGPHEGRKCPYGNPGDRLWVKETWAQVHPIQVSEGRFSLKGRAGIPGPPPVDYRVIYRSDGEYQRIHFQRGEPKYPYRELCVEGCKREHIHPEERWNGWASSALMPRWASRITLEIVSVRVERLQDISEEDAIAEGCEMDGDFPRPQPDASGIGEVGWDTAVEWYSWLWESINGFGSWDLNPWVWVIEFKEAKP
jgi:hypothetical protein